MAGIPQTTPEILRQLLRYDPETGKLFWLPRPTSAFQAGRYPAESVARAWNTRRAGQEALCTPDSYGYLLGYVQSERVKAHRVIWAFVHGEWPNGEIDHINGNRADNRIANLRVVTRLGNMRNLAISCKNSSGASGISWNTRQQRWSARIGKKGERLGDFETFDEALAARKSAERAIGYHPNHGTRRKLGEEG